MHVSLRNTARLAYSVYYGSSATFVCQVSSTFHAKIVSSFSSSVTLLSVGSGELTFSIRFQIPSILRTFVPVHGQAAGLFADCHLV